MDAKFVIPAKLDVSLVNSVTLHALAVLAVKILAIHAKTVMVEDAWSVIAVKGHVFWVRHVQMGAKFAIHARPLVSLVKYVTYAMSVLDVSYVLPTV